MISYIIAIDASSSACRAALIDESGRVIRESSLSIGTSYLNDFRIEQDPEEIFNAQLKVIKNVLSDVDPKAIKGIGISNQRETVIAWDPISGIPLYPAISWQDRRNLSFFDEFKEHEELIRQKTGLVFHTYFSASKIKWLLEHLQGKGFKVGTIDSWLIFKLTNHQVFATDVSNASRTMLMDIEKLCWSKELLEIFQIPEVILPQIKNSLDDYGYWEYRGERIPILGVLGDQQAALFALGEEQGIASCTYGTGAFLLANCGPIRKIMPDTLTTVAWKLGEEGVYYALESSLFSCGNVLKKWERERIIGSYEMATKTYINSFFLPSFNGNLFLMNSKEYKNLEYNRDLVLWDSEGTLKSFCNGVALAVNHMLSFFKGDLNIRELWVNGKVSNLGYLNDVQASLCGLTVIKYQHENQSILGIAYLTGMGAGFWNIEEVQKFRTFSGVWLPKETNSVIKELKNNWKKLYNK